MTAMARRENPPPRVNIELSEKDVLLEIVRHTNWPLTKLVAAAINYAVPRIVADPELLKAENNPPLRLEAFQSKTFDELRERARAWVACPGGPSLRVHHHPEPTEASPGVTRLANELRSEQPSPDETVNAPAKHLRKDGTPRRRSAHKAPKRDAGPDTPEERREREGR